MTTQEQLNDLKAKSEAMRRILENVLGYELLWIDKDYVGKTAGNCMHALRDVCTVHPVTVYCDECKDFELITRKGG